MLEVIYAAIVMPPFFLSSHARVRIFGVLLGLSMFAAYAFYAHAFTSVWCFFAAAISFFMVYLLYRETR